MDIKIFNSAGVWPSGEVQRKMRDVWGFDSGPFLDLVAEQLEEMAASGSITLVVRDVAIGAKDYLVVNVGEYSVTPDIAQIVVNAESPEILRVLSSTSVMGEAVDSDLIEKVRDAKIDRAGCAAILGATKRYGREVLTPILEAIKGGLTAGDAVSVVTGAVERGSEAGELITVRRRTELIRKF